MTSTETVVAHLWHQVTTRPDDPAMLVRGEAGWTPTTWHEFGETAELLASFLVSEGVRAQQHVAIWAGNRPEWHLADAAILSVRCRPVPVYHTLSQSDARYVLEQSGSRIAFVETQTQLDNVLAERGNLPHLQRIVVLDPAVDVPTNDELVVTWDEALSHGRDALATTATRIASRRDAVAPSDVATLIYTSGTSGRAKAVKLTHANIMAAMRSLEAVVPPSGSDRVISYLPLAHIAERMVSEFRGYTYGSPTYFLDGFEHLGERLAEVRPQIFFAVPRVWEKMAQKVQQGVAAQPRFNRGIANWAIGVGRRVAEVRAAGGEPNLLLAQQYRTADKLVLHKLRATLGLDGARFLASGAAPIGRETLMFFNSLGLELCEVYGQSENCGLSTINAPGASRPGTVGRPLQGVDVEIAPDGEILVRGGNVFAGYHGDKAATAETLDGEWLRTGDIGAFTDEGYLRITDRKKDLVITAGGKNISPSNIEMLIADSDLISRAVAIGDRKPFISALVTLDPDGLRQFARAHNLSGGYAQLVQEKAVIEAVAAHMASVNEKLSHVEQVKRWTILPRDFIVGDELTPTNKIKRKAVAEKYAPQIEEIYATPRGLEA